MNRERNKGKQYQFLYSLLIVLPWFCLCNKNPTTPTQQLFPLEYTVSIPAMNQNSIKVECLVRSWRYSDSVRFAAPPLYADNPLLRCTGAAVQELWVTDTLNTSISFTKDSVNIGIHKSLCIALDKASLPVKISYVVCFPYETDSTSILMPIPRIGTHKGYFQGNYVFLIPYNSTQLVHLWRNFFPAYVEYKLGPDMRLFGNSPHHEVFENPYELLFETFAIIPEASVSHSLLFNGSVSNQAYQCVSLSDTITFPLPAITYVENNLKIICEDVVKVFGPQKTPITLITGINEKIGLEGTNAFCVCNPVSIEQDQQGAKVSILAHELIHYYIGVHMGEKDMAWWKEGTTQYAGLLLTKRNNLCSKSYFKSALVDFDLGQAAEYCLADPNLRPALFQNKYIGTLFYRKGGQITMLIDREIHRASKNTLGILDILSELYNRFQGDAFTESEYVRCIYELSGADVTPIIEAYVKTTGVIPLSVRTEAFEQLGAVYTALGNFR